MVCMCNCIKIIVLPNTKLLFSGFGFIKKISMSEKYQNIHEALVLLILNSN